MNVIDRIEQRLVECDHGYLTPCLIFTGSLDSYGYGKIGWTPEVGGPRRYRSTHRLMYERYVGCVPAGLELDHLCRQRDCSEVTHLEAVTRRENVLRGTTPELLAIRNGRDLTHCPRGHEWTPENTYLRPDRAQRPTRMCRACARIRTRAYRAQLSTTGSLEPSL